MGTCGVLAKALRYPAVGRLEVLEAGLSGMPAGEERDAYGAYLGYVQRLGLGEWEELYTRTWDLNPAVVPYVGYQIWGDNYQRGNFMADMSRALRENAIELAGELPDHLVLVLHYLDVCSQPIPELMEILERSLQKTQTDLRKTDQANPYNELLAAVAQTVHMIVKNLEKEKEK
jgi:nitrate reductase delta subunit